MSIGLLRTWTASVSMIVTLAAPSFGQDAATEPIPIAVAEFDYRDTSGEVRDQQAEHAARLEAFTRMIRADLEESGRYRIVPLTCPEPPCTAGRADPEELLADARKAGAKFLLFGGIQKMSTLIQYGKAVVVDLEADKSVFERLLTFRGDTDDAWRHAEKFLVREFLSQDFQM